MINYILIAILLAAILMKYRSGNENFVYYSTQYYPYETYKKPVVVHGSQGRTVVAGPHRTVVSRPRSVYRGPYGTVVTKSPSYVVY
jgi:hypothetical protein